MSLSRRSFSETISLHITIGAAVVMFSALLAVAAHALVFISNDLSPDLQRKALTLATIISNEFQRADRLDLAIADLRNVDDFLEDVIDDHHEIRYAAFVTPDGRLEYASHQLMRDRAAGDATATLLLNWFATTAAAQPSPVAVAVGDVLDLTVAVIGRKGELGRMHVGIDANFTRNQILGISADIFITVFIAALITVEVLLLMLALSVGRQVQGLKRQLAAGAQGDFSHTVTGVASGGLGAVTAEINRIINDLGHRVHVVRRHLGAQGTVLSSAVLAELRGLTTHYQLKIGDALPIPAERDANDLRLPLFLFLFGTELSRSFWPLFVGQLYQPVPYLSANFAMALPMSLWVVVMMVATPVGTWLSHRRGARFALLVGMLPTGVGLLFTGLATDYYTLLAWRMVCAAGFGLVTVSALIHIAEASPKGQRAGGMSVFVGASVAASVCGTAIGGILADYIGYRLTFMVAAGLVTLAAVLLSGLMSAPAAAAAERGQGAPGGAGRFLRILLLGRILTFVLLAAAPLRLILTGFLFYMLPLYLSNAGYGQAAIGRFMMGYFIVMVLINPLVARLADRLGCHRTLMVSGGVVCGLGTVLFVQSAGLVTAMVGIALVGLGQALTTTPQLSIIGDHFAKECHLYGLPTLLAVFRVVERVGSIAGPLVAAALIAALGYTGCAVALGGGTVIASLCLWAHFLFEKKAEALT